VCTGAELKEPEAALRQLASACLSLLSLPQLASACKACKLKESEAALPQLASACLSLPQPAKPQAEQPQRGSLTLQEPEAALPQLASACLSLPQPAALRLLTGGALCFLSYSLRQPLRGTSRSLSLRQRCLRLLRSGSLSLRQPLRGTSCS
jgi:hypothetical protein